ncbi:MAG: MgtC/SapB family protein [Gemmatimonadetes bacterium]|nr:MgtC/SapB family protein [Gemmatimonadota bacterium]
MEHFLVSLGLPASLVAALKLGTLGRLLLAGTLGGLVGLERELKAKPAGLRTTLLICVGAALFTELSLDLAMLATAGGDALRADPARLAAQIIPGIGFIGAGAILHGRGRVSGLTTAATLWVVTAIGIAVGAGAYVEAIGTTVMVLGTLLLLGRVEKWVRRHLSNRKYTAAVDVDTDAFERLVETFRGGKLQFRVDTMEKVGNDVEVTFRVVGPQEDHEKLVKHMLHEKGVRRFKRS